MQTFTVYAEMITDLEVQIEANSIEEALEKTKNFDPFDFEQSTTGGSFRILDDFSKDMNKNNK